MILSIIGGDFVLPTCANVFNIFHPSDPIAYRIEPLIDPNLAQQEPALVPHYRGKTMRSEIQGWFSQLHQTVFSLGGVIGGTSAEEKQEKPNEFYGLLNGGSRVDYVLQVYIYIAYSWLNSYCRLCILYIFIFIHSNFLTICK